MHIIRALDRGIQVLLRVNAAGTATLHDLHEATGMSKATLLRIDRKSTRLNSSH